MQNFNISDHQPNKISEPVRPRESGRKKKTDVSKPKEDEDIRTERVKQAKKLKPQDTLVLGPNIVVVTKIEMRNRQIEGGSLSEDVLVYVKTSNSKVHLTTSFFYARETVFSCMSKQTSDPHPFEDESVSSPETAGLVVASLVINMKCNFFLLPFAAYS